MTRIAKYPDVFTSLPRWFDDFFTKDAFDMEQPLFRREVTIPAVNIVEDDKNFMVELAAPGMKKNDFKIEVENNVLTISAELKEEKKEEEKNYTRREYNYTAFTRSWTLPKDIVDADKIKATYKEGILHLEIPKLELTVKKVPKKITVG